MAVKSRKNKTDLNDSNNINSTEEEIKQLINESESKIINSNSETELPIKINTSNLLELKHTCDDAVKEYFSKPTSFVQSHIHEDIRLILGWSAAIIGFSAAYYGYTTPFQESKTVVGTGVVIYAVLSFILTCYGIFIEKEIIFEGKRRTVTGRVSTERLTISTTASSGLPIPSYFSSTYLLSLLLPSLFSTSSTPTPSSPYPNYTITLNYIHSSNNGKILIHQSVLTEDRCFGDFFDKEGRFWKEGFEIYLSGLLSKVVGEV